MTAAYSLHQSETGLDFKSADVPQKVSVLADYSYWSHLTRQPPWYLAGISSGGVPTTIIATSQVTRLRSGDVVKRMQQAYLARKWWAPI